MYECNHHLHIATAALLVAIMAMIYMINGGKLFIASICTLMPGLLIVRTGIVGISGRFRAHIIGADGRPINRPGLGESTSEGVDAVRGAPMLQPDGQSAAGKSVNKVVPT